MQNHCQNQSLNPLWVKTTPSAQQRLWCIVQAHDELMQVLGILQQLDGTAYVAAGVLRHVVWAHLHEMSYSLSGTEIDVIFYDQNDMNDQHAKKLQHALATHFPSIQWDVTNQATVHQWYRTEQGESIALLQSLEQALSFWPETATALALRLDEHAGAELIAPFGLHDLFELKLRWNPTLVSYEIFEQRCSSKRFLEKWPKLELIQH